MGLDFVNKPELRRLWDEMEEYVAAQTYSRREILDLGILPPTDISGKSDAADSYSKAEIDDMMARRLIIEHDGDGVDADPIPQDSVLSICRL